MSKSSMRYAAKYVVVVQYDCRLGDKGTIVSRHSTQELAERAAKRTGFDSFLAIKTVYPGPKGNSAMNDTITEAKEAWEAAQKEVERMQEIIHSEIEPTGFIPEEFEAAKTLEQQEGEAYQAALDLEGA